MSIFKWALTASAKKLAMLFVFCLVSWFLLVAKVYANPAVTHKLTDRNTGTVDYLDLGASRIVIGDIAYKLALERTVYKKDGEQGTALDLKVGEWVTFESDSYRVNDEVTKIWVLSKQPTINAGEEE